MKSVYIHKISQYNYFFTFVKPTCEHTERNAKYKFMGEIQVEDDVIVMSLHITHFKGNGKTEEINISKLDNYEKSLRLFTADVNKSIEEKIINVFYYCNKCNIFSNICRTDIAYESGYLISIFIPPQEIFSIDLDTYVANQSTIFPFVNNVTELSNLLNKFDENELKVYIINLPISVSDFRRWHSKNIDEYHIPKLGLSYNCSDGLNVLFGNNLDERYIQSSEKTEKPVEIKKEIILKGEDLKNILDSLKDYVKHQLNVHKLFLPYSEI